MKVAIQGFKGSYHAIAATTFFQIEPELVTCDSFQQLFKVMKNDLADYAVMAIENTVAGTLLPNYALLRNSELVIIGEIFLRIEHNLLVLKGQNIGDIKEVRSHPMALLQCHSFFDQHPDIKLIEDVDTALVAQQINENNLLGVGAIAGKLAAKVFDLDVLVPSIEDNKRNFTRFLVLRKKSKVLVDINDIPEKSSICFHIPNISGRLNEILGIIASKNINITKIQSTPLVGTEWEYFIHLDLEFEDYYDYKKSVEAIEQITNHFKVLGEYKRGIKDYDN